MCNCKKPCCYPTPCCPKNPCAPTTKVNTTDITYTGDDLECSGIESGIGLNQLIKDLDTFICANSSEQTVSLLNVGDGEGSIYAGDNLLGQKQLRTITGDESIDVSTVGNTIEVSVNETWASENLGNVIFPENIVEFNTVDPNSGGPTFTPNTPEDPDALYFSNVNNTNWIWNGTIYVTAPPSPNSTPFNLAGTITDAGGNKVASISRKGSVGINIATPQKELHVVGAIRQTEAINTMVKASVNGDLVAATAGVEYLAPTGSAALLTGFPTLNQNTTGNAATVTTIPTLSGDVTNIGNAVTLVNSGVVSGTYVNPTITVDSKGRVTIISSGSTGRALADFYTTVTNSTNTLTTLYTYTLPANTLVADGDKLTITYGGKIDNNPTSKTITFSLGAGSYSLSSTREDYFSMKVDIIRASNTTCGVTIFWGLGNYLDFFTYSDYFTITGFNANQAINLLGQGTNTGDISALMGSIIYTPAAI